MSVLASRMTALGTENAFKLGEDIARVVGRGMDVVKFNLGEPDFDSAPHINKVGAEQIHAGNTHYCDPAGILPFRQAIADHVEKTRGRAVDPARIVVTPGAKPPISYSLPDLCRARRRGDLPQPGLSDLRVLGDLRRRRAEAAAPVRGARLRLHRRRPGGADLEKTKLIILNSPSNPTGGVLSAGLIGEIAELVKEKCRPDVRVYSDEVYEHILFDGESHSSIWALPGMEENTLLVSGHSKGFAMTGWRLGWAVLPTKQEAAVFKQLNINICSCVPPFIQEAGREAYESPETAATVATMVHGLRAAARLGGAGAERHPRRALRRCPRAPSTSFPTSPACARAWG